MGELMMDFFRRLLHKGSGEWQYAKRCCTAIKLGVATKPIDVVFLTQNT
jgi:hypothetical protein